jgi:hypothetical protein
MTWQSHPIWYLELMNANSGLRIGKRFQQSLVLGRFVGTGEQQNMLYLDRSNTISRRHVKATVHENGVSVENLSSINIARLNGKALVYPDWLRYRDQLQVGDETYIVTAGVYWVGAGYLHAYTDRAKAILAAKNITWLHQKATESGTIKYKIVEMYIPEGTAYYWNENIGETAAEALEWKPESPVEIGEVQYVKKDLPF